MAFLQLLPIHHHSHLLFPRPFPPSPSQLDSSFPKSLSLNPRKPLSLFACSSYRNALPTTEQEFLQAVTGSEDKRLPCVRCYENDLARLTLVGAVDFEQALTAAAADGGEAASEHVDNGMEAMVVETVYPGPSRDHSSISTRLFLPARKVEEKAKKIRKSLDQDMLSSTTSRNILAMTFKQVVMQQLWSFELMLFKPGTERNMEDLGNQREVSASFSLSSSDEHPISILAEVVCIAALESTKRQFNDNSGGRALIDFSSWFRKPRKIASKDSSVIIYELFEDENFGDVRSLLNDFQSEKGQYKPLASKLKQSWWTLPAFSKLENIGGPEFSCWACEHLPAYRLQIDAGKLEKNAKFEGWKKSVENRWEVLMTHSQMLSLASILDMYYEDLYTLPEKAISCSINANLTNSLVSKSSSPVYKVFSIIIASGIFLIALSLGQLFLPQFQGGRKPFREHSLRSSSEISIPQLTSLESTESEGFCISIARKIKDGFGWDQEIVSDTKVGAWIGEPPSYLMGVTEAEGTLTVSPETDNADIRSSAQDIASYQVVLSTDGRLVGFQPTSRIAVNHWAANPLAKELYGGRRLSPGFVELGLKLQYPEEVVVLELLMSTNPDMRFLLVRPVQ